MRPSIAVLVTVAIVFGVPVAIMLLVEHIMPNDVAQLVAVLVGVAFGVFAIDIYTALRERGIDS